MQKLLALLLALLIGGGLFFIAANNHSNQEQSPHSSDTQESSPIALATESELVTQPNSSLAAPQPVDPMVVIERTDWKLAQPLHTQLASLKNQANQGDLQATYILAMNLRFCSLAPQDETGLEARLQQAYQYKDDGIAIANIKNRYQFCEGIDQQQRNEFYAYLETAAKAGYVYAQEEMATVTPELFMQLAGATELEREAYIQKRDEFIQLQLFMLESASQQGSIRALIQLSTMHHSQNYGEQGRAKAYAINQIILELTDDNELQSRYSDFLQRRQAELTPEQIEQAQVLSEQWMAIIKANGSLYLP